MNGAPEWEFPKMMHLLPSNAKSFGERLEAPRKPYIREDLALAMVAAAYEAAAQACGDDAYARGLPDQLTACAEAIRALTPDDARAALARMMAERAAPKVKPLAWERSVLLGEVYKAASIFGEYICGIDDDNIAYGGGVPDARKWIDYDTLEAAKAAAQADYERRIREALG